MKKPHVIVAMSGGVDSSVAAAVLKKRGYEVSGIFLRTWFDRSIAPGAENRCCSIEAGEAAARVCHKFDIPFQIVNALVPFKKRVVDYFLSELAAGRTPNPCIPCNQFVRFDYLLKLARQKGANYLATGHYLQLHRKGSRIEVWRGRDRNKDQSYFQYTLTQKKLKHLLFPLGQYTKSQVRALARKYKLPAFNRDESQDICFIPKGKYQAFLAKYLDLKSGPITTTEGKIMGQHKGLVLYTIGQRSGLGIGGSKPFYVVKKNTSKNRLVVAQQADVGRFQNNFFVKKASFISGQPPKLPFYCSVQTRYRQKAFPAVLTRERRRYLVTLKKAAVGITPGQSAVFYKGKQLIGGGEIVNN